MEIKFTKRKLPEYKMTASETVKILSDKPHLLTRIEISGEFFPHRDAPAFVHIRTEREKHVYDYFTEVSPDNQKLIGYLPVDAPTEGVIEFGFGTEIWGSITKRFTPDTLIRLDRKKLPKDLVIVDANFLKQKRK
jgi:hypothetical protein